MLAFALCQSMNCTRVEGHSLCPSLHLLVFPHVDINMLTREGCGASAIGGVQ